MRTSNNNISTLLLFTVALATIFSCTSVPLSSVYMNDSNYDPSDLQLLEVYKNLEFRAANNDEFLYFQVTINSDSTNKKYAQSILNLWFNSDGSHSKKTGFQFPIRKTAHPFLKTQFSSLTAWGGFKSILSDTQKVRVSDYLEDAESKILYFNINTGTIDLIEPDGRSGFSISRNLTKQKMILDFVVPLNANGNEMLGVLNTVDEYLSIGFEILSGSNINRSRPQPSQGLSSPGIGRPSQTTGRSNIGSSQLKKTSELHWLKVILATTDKTL